MSVTRKNDDYFIKCDICMYRERMFSEADVYFHGAMETENYAEFLHWDHLQSKRDWMLHSGWIRMRYRDRDLDLCPKCYAAIRKNERERWIAAFNAEKCVRNE